MPADPKISKKTQKLFNYSYYSGIGFQLIAIVVLAVWGGLKLDQHMKNKFPVFTFIFSVLAIIVSLYSLLKDLTKRKKD